jgi:NAD(P)-dependent dehydrogenase (short-subunit alcohol dehydrogenase family)
VLTCILGRINSKAAFFILKAAARHISDDGKIITIVTALLGAFTGFYTSYAGSKAPVEHFTRGVCKELQARRVSVNNVAPGPMDTRKLCQIIVEYEGD